MNTPGRELDLLAKYPKGKRDPGARAEEKTPEDVRIARQFGREFFDGERRHGYGGYTYTKERWSGVVDDLMQTYRPDSVLDVGCAKGHMLLAMYDTTDSLTIGLDVSPYAISCAPAEMKPYVQVGDARSLPWGDKSFDLVVSINTVHNLDRPDCIQALREIQRVGRRAYVTVDTYRNDEEQRRMFDWNLTALTILHVDGWRKLFAEAGYTGDYGWFIP